MYCAPTPTDGSLKFHKKHKVKNTLEKAAEQVLCLCHSKHSYHDWLFSLWHSLGTVHDEAGVMLKLDLLIIKQKMPCKPEFHLLTTEWQKQNVRNK